MSRVLKFYMAHLEMQMYEYQELTQNIDHFLDGLSTVNTSCLSPALVSPDVLSEGIWTLHLFSPLYKITINKLQILL